MVIENPLPFWVGIESLLFCLLLTPFVKLMARKKKWLAHPKEERWHKKPTALFGGIAIYLSFSLALLPYVDLKAFMPHIMERGLSPVPVPSIISVIWLGGTLLFLLGLIDDFLHIKPHSKLVGQILVSALIVYLGFRMQWFKSLSLDTMITIIWLVGLTNAFNLIDNMDGLCAGVALIAALFLAAIFWDTSQHAAIAAIALAGALAGFLVYNFKPASIFMGDCGSLVVGFTLAMLSLSYPATTGKEISVYAVPIMILIVPIFDTTMVTIIRTLSGRKASTGGRDHTSHRLVLMGFSEKKAVLFLYGIGMVSGWAALFVHKTDTLTSPTVIIPLIFSMLLIGIYLAQLRIYPEQEFSALRNRPYTPILMELTYKKQLLMVLLDLCIIAFSYYLSYRLILEDIQISKYFNAFLGSLPIIIGCKIIVFFIVGVYRGIWRYMSSNDVYVYLKASLYASILSVAIVALVYRFDNFPKGIILIDWLITTGLLLGSRGSFRIFVDIVKKGSKTGDPVLIYGAGRGGEILLRELLNNKNYDMKPIGFIDDDYLKTGKKILGFPILGQLKDIDKIFDKFNFRVLIISFKKKKNEKADDVFLFCKKNNINIKKLSLDVIEL